MPDPNAKYLVRTQKLHDGTQWLYEFPNGLEVSVIDNGYGRKSGLNEMAVSRGDEMIVEGWMNDADIRQNLSRIRREGINAELVIRRAPRSRLGRVEVRPYIHWRS